MGIDIKVPDSIDHAAENLTGPLTKAAGNTFGDLWFLALGGISHRADLRRAKYACELEVFRQNTEKKIGDIPEEKRIEPSTQIIMSALTDAQYCVEEESLRTMFENLISSSLNSDKTSKIHPSFTGIIKSMSALDASNIMHFRKAVNYPAVKCIFSYESQNSNVMFDPIVFVIPTPPGILDETNCRSFSYLSKLGLLSIQYDRVHSNPDIYQQFYSSSRFQAMNMLKERSQNRERLRIKAIEVIEGLVEITQLGMDFLDVCGVS